MVRKKRRKSEIAIKGRIWTFEVVSEKAYDSRHPEKKGTPAVCCFPNRIVDIRANYPITAENMRHEILHCFVFETNTESTTNDADDREEICASIIGEYYFDLGILSEKIVRDLVG